jgi:hypothetical protein
MGMNERTTAIGSVRMGTRALRKWKRKKRITRLTITISSMSERWSVLTA